MQPDLCQRLFKASRGCRQAGGRQGSVLAQAAAEPGPRALIYFRKPRTQLLDSLNIAPSKWKNNLDSAVYNQQTSSHLRRRDMPYNVRKSALCGGRGGRKVPAEGGQTLSGSRVSPANTAAGRCKGTSACGASYSFYQSKKQQCPNGKKRRNL